MSPVERPAWSANAPAAKLQRKRSAICDNAGTVGAVLVAQLLPRRVCLAAVDGARPSRTVHHAHAPRHYVGGAIRVAAGAVRAVRVAKPTFRCIVLARVD